MASNSRKPHRLRSEKTLAIPRHVIFFDVESDMLETPGGKIYHKLKLGWACYYRWGGSQRADRVQWRYFTTLNGFWSFILDKTTAKNRLWLIAHNLSYDFIVLEGFRVLKREGYKLKFFYSKGQTTLIKVTAPKKSMVFVDSLNWFKESLASLGERLGVPKLKVDFTTVKVSQLKSYCRRDVEILLLGFKSLVSFLRGRQVSRLCYTLGSTAMAAFLFSHYNDNIFIHNNQEAIDLERDSYKGGRTECFYLGERTDGPFYVVDVNSLYPFVMRNNPYPVKYQKYYPAPTRSQFVSALNDNAVVAQVLLSTHEAVYAVRRQRTVFPVGRFWVTLTTPELVYALKYHKILAVSRMAVYEKAFIFTSYVDRFYRLRRELVAEGNVLYAHFAKDLLNSLYGKFGQLGEIWEKIGAAPDEPDRVEILYDVVTKTRRKLRYLLGEVFELVGSDETRHSFPGIAAHVTAYARLYLYKLMQSAGAGNYFYCDTDSLFVNSKGLANLSDFLHPDRLGGLKVERKSQKLILYGLKDYVLDDKQVLKGIKSTAEKLTDTLYRQTQWPTIQGLLSRADADSYYNLIVEKTLQRLYTKAMVYPDGSVSPFVLADDSLDFPKLPLRGSIYPYE